MSVMRNFWIFLIAAIASVTGFPLQCNAQDFLSIVPHREIEGKEQDLFKGNSWYMGYRHEVYVGPDVFRKLDCIYGFTSGMPSMLEKPYVLKYSKFKPYKVERSYKRHVKISDTCSLQVSESTWLMLENLFREAGKAMRISDPGKQYIVFDGPSELCQFTYFGNLGTAGCKEGTNCGKLKEISELVCTAIQKSDESMILAIKDEILQLTENFKAVSNYVPNGGYDAMYWCW